MIEYEVVNDFTNWLNEELGNRGWQQIDLAQRASIGNSTLSRILNGIRPAGPDVCRKIARAFGYPPEEVFRRAGLLPPAPQEGYSETIKRLIGLVSQLPEMLQKDILDYAEWRYLQLQDEDPTESIRLLGDELERLFSLLNPNERAEVLSRAARDRRFRDMAREIVRRKSL